MKLFVWDFHGVLEKGNDAAVIEISNLALREGGYSRKLTHEHGMVMAGRSWHEYFSYLYPEILLTEALQLQQRSIEISIAQPEIIAKHIQLNDYAKEVLQKIAESPFTQIIISNCLPSMLDFFLKQIEMEDYFPIGHRFGVASSTPSQPSKGDCLKAFLVGRTFSKGIVVIGDSPSDMDLIDDSEAVGYHYSYPGRPHRPAKSHYRIHDLREILREVDPVAYV